MWKRVIANKVKQSLTKDSDRINKIDRMSVWNFSTNQKPTTTYTAHRTASRFIMDTLTIVPMVQGKFHKVSVRCRPEAKIDTDTLLRTDKI